MLNKKLNKIAYFEGKNLHKTKTGHSTGSSAEVKVLSGYDSGIHIWLSGDDQISLVKRFKSPKNNIAAADLKSVTFRSFWYDFDESWDQNYDDSKWNL